MRPPELLSSNISLDTRRRESYGRGFRAPWRPLITPSAQIPMSHDPQWFQHAGQALPYAWLIVDRRGTIRACNHAALALLAMDDVQVLNRHVLEVVPAWQNTPLAKALPGWLDGEAGGPTDFELALSGECTIRLTLTPLPDAQSGGGHVLLTALDITEIVKLKQRLRWTEYQASVGKLARGIAHELNNPLDGVSRYTHLALEQLREDTPVREYLVHVKEGLDRMVRAVRAFLEFSRQAVTPINRTADVNHLIEDALILFKHRAKFQHIQIVTELDRALPPVVDGGLQHAVVNLIKNGFDAMPRGGMLSLRTRQTDVQVEIEVEDTGSGIAEDVRARIFEPFFTTKPIHQGSGLGLIIAKEVVERSNGQITFESQPGVGTRFVILIPLGSVETNGHGS